jgi:hypothetical protein
VGEFGGNDYAAPLFAFRPLSEARALVPHVVDSIAEGVEKLIAEGAADLVVPGVLPTGCFPLYLSTFRRRRAGEYGARSGCVKDLNTLSWLHNAALRRRVTRLRARHPGVRIVYADYYTPAMQFVLHAEKWGESAGSTPRLPSMHPCMADVFVSAGRIPEADAACVLRSAGRGRVQLHPSNHWSWDGIHLTEASYGHIAKGWLYGPFADPPILSARRQHQG